MKYRFRIIYQTKKLKKTSDLMKRLDLGCGEVAFTEIVTFSSEKEGITVSKFKETIVNGYELSGCTVLNIEGGSIE